MIWEYIEDYEIYNLKLIERKRIIFGYDKFGEDIILKEEDIENDFKGDDG